MSTLKSFEDLNCWKAGTEVRRFIMKLIKKFPSEEKYALTDDMRRASRSVTHNIAEGFGRFHFKDNTRFCRYTKGSLTELVDQLITAQDEGYITAEEYKTSFERFSAVIVKVSPYSSSATVVLSKRLEHDKRVFPSLAKEDEV